MIRVFLAAGVTNSPEHAQITTLPLSLGILALVNNARIPLADSLPLLVPTLAWVVIAIALASRLFRREPRR